MGNPYKPRSSRSTAVLSWEDVPDGNAREIMEWVEAADTDEERVSRAQVALEAEAERRDEPRKKLSAVLQGIVGDSEEDTDAEAEDDEESDESSLDEDTDDDEE